MDRRTFLGGLIGAVAMPALPAWAQDAPARVPSVPPGLRPKVRPGEPGWPSAADWERLKASVGGRLVPAPSPFEACRTGQRDAACTTMLESIGNPFFLQEQPGGTQVSGWLDAWEAKPSVHAVAAETVGDVVAAVNFARERNLRLVVKGGGHSLHGQSNAPDSLLLWTRGLRQMDLHDDFVPQGGEGGELPGPAVSVGAGARFLELYDLVTTRNGRYVQGSARVTETVGGHLQAGGFGSFSKGFGVCAAGLLEAEVVTADGQVQIANRYRNADLFYAIRGGGAGFGVVTRATLRIFRMPETFGFLDHVIRARGGAEYRRLLAAFAQFASENLITPHWGEEVSINPDNTLRIAMAFQGLSEAEARAVWRPFWGWLFENAALLADATPPTIRSMPAEHWWDRDYLLRNAPGTIIPDNRPGGYWRSADADDVGAFMDARDCVWLPQRLIAPSLRDVFVETMFLASRQARISLDFSKGLAGASAAVLEETRELAINPIAADSFALAVVSHAQPRRFPGVAGHEPDREAGLAAAARVRETMGPLRRLAPDGGGYGPDSDYVSEAWRTAGWGPNYTRLMRAKLRFDPAGVFFGHHAVGSEFWSADGFTPVA